MTAALRKALPRLEMNTSAVLIGSVAADIPLFILSAGAYVYFHNVLQWSLGDTFRHMYDHLYFEDPYWKTFHNFLHVPVGLLACLLVATAIRTRRPRISAWFMWFIAACALHTCVDVLTHHDDGPLLLWPFNWSYRFQSPISYWDSNHYGTQFALIELVFDAGCTVFLIGPWLLRQAKKLLASEAE